MLNLNLESSTLSLHCNHQLYSIIRYIAHTRQSHCADLLQKEEPDRLFFPVLVRRFVSLSLLAPANSAIKLHSPNSKLISGAPPSVLSTGQCKVLPLSPWRPRCPSRDNTRECHVPLKSPTKLSWISQTRNCCKRHKTSC